MFNNIRPNGLGHQGVPKCFWEDTTEEWNHPEIFPPSDNIWKENRSFRTIGSGNFSRIMGAFKENLMDTG